MKELFEVAGGSVTSRLHTQNLNRRNNQDAFGWRFNDRSLIAVVCDGCGSSPHSEVGARIGCELLLNEISVQSALLRSYYPQELLEAVRHRVLFQIQMLAQGFGGQFAQTINDYFLFSTVGAIVSEKTVLIFSLGDGLFSLNGQVREIGPFRNNAPPYLSYGLVRTSLPTESLAFQTQELVLSAEESQTLLIGTDGVNDLIKIADTPLPGRDELVGPLSQFWENDRYFRNPDMVRRRLALINQEHTEVVWGEHRIEKRAGLLPDDTTLVAIRRKKE